MSSALMRRHWRPTPGVHDHQLNDRHVALVQLGEEVMAALFANFQSGTTTTAPLLIAGTTLDSAGFANLPTIAAPDYMWLTLDPTGVAGLPEIVQVTAHAGAATTLTIVRAQQATAARQHLAATIWRHSATKSDFDELPFRKLTTVGDTLYAGALNTATRLPVGVNGALLTVVRGVPVWTTSTAPGSGVGTAWTPTVTQGATPVFSTASSYSRIGRRILGDARITVTSGGGTASNNVVVGFPVATGANYAGQSVLGTAQVYRASATSAYTANLVWLSTTTAILVPSLTLTTGAALGTTGFTAALAVNDQISWNFSYEAAVD
jgi:hypothetical protein